MKTAILLIHEKLCCLNNKMKRFLRTHIAARFLLILTAILILMLILMQILFVCTKGTAYISFSSAEAEQDHFTYLHSQCTQISADSFVACVSQCTGLSTTITADRLGISATSLTDWGEGYLSDNGITDYNELYLLIQSNGEPYEAELVLYSMAQNDSIRYEITSASEISVDPVSTPGLRSFAQKAAIWNAVSDIDGYNSFVSVPRHMKICVPLDPNIELFVVYQGINGKWKQLEVSAGQLPGYSETDNGSNWSFGIDDAFIEFFSSDNRKFQMDVSGNYILDLWSNSTSSIYTYLSGELSFHYATTPQIYTLNDQLFRISSGKDTLELAMRKGIAAECDDEYLSFQGMAKEINFSGFNPYPNLKMWIRDNLYVAPLSLFSAIISVYKLSPEKKKKIKLIQPGETISKKEDA